MDNSEPFRPPQPVSSGDLTPPPSFTPDPQPIAPLPPPPPSPQPTHDPTSIYPTPQPHVPPPPIAETPAAEEALPGPADLTSQPVVRVLSPRGIEYVFLTIALFTGAIGLGAALISLVNGQASFDVLAFPVASLIVSLPVFGWLFMRLKQMEVLNPSLRYEASKRRSTQFTQIASFVVAFFTLIGFVTTFLAKLAGEYHGSIVKVFLDVLIVLLIAGGLLFYYWRDEHRS
jgi:hypothetical protein